MALAQCRECRKEVSTEASSCPHCGVPGPTGAAAGRSDPSSVPATGSPFAKRPPIVSPRQERAAQTEATGLPVEVDFSHLPEYYRKEFQKIYQSKETYTGKWNWAAFLFGLIWGVTKGLWLAALIALVAAFLTAGIGGLLYCFIFGVRGNFMYYAAYVKRKQLPV